MASTLATAPDLKALRRAAGLSQQRVAERAGCSLSMIRILESGYVPEHSDVLPRVLAALIDPSTTEAPVGTSASAKTGGQAGHDRG